MHHLTTGTFNYVVKDPDCFRLSGQLWIKDEPNRSQGVSSNLMALYRSSKGLPMPEGQPSILLPVQAKSHILPEIFARRIRRLAGLSRVTQKRVTFCANLLRLSKISWHVKVNQVYTCVKLGSLCLIACKPSCIDGPNRHQAILKQ